MAFETGLVDPDAYEVRIYDTTRGRLLVAAIEIVSPANKDRLEHRNAFVAKCAFLLEKGVAVSIIDLVTARHANLYLELLRFVGRDDLAPPEPPDLYSTSCRHFLDGKRQVFKAWVSTLVLGQPLPVLPLWLNETVVIPLDLEPSYEQACNDLAISDA